MAIIPRIVNFNFNFIHAALDRCSGIDALDASFISGLQFQTNTVPPRFYLRLVYVVCFSASAWWSAKLSMVS